MVDGDMIYETLKKLVEPDKIFFDIGANIGQTTIISSRRVGVGGRIVAFEPSARNIQMLKYHVRWNRLSNVQVEETCVGASNGEVEFSLVNDGLDSSNSLTFSRKCDLPEMKRKLQKVMVPITTIDDFCRRTGIMPDVVKIDVEGAEYDVLMGAKEVLMTKRPKLLMGVHPFWWPDGQAKTAIQDFLRGCDYQVTNVQGEEAAPDAYADFVCVPRPA